MELVALARNPVPSGAVIGTFAGYDGAPLRYARFEATRGPRRGTACVFGGRTEFIEKYFEVIADLRRRGFAVATMDWRGQGGSHRTLPDRHKGHITSYSEFDRDLANFMREVVLPDCPPPYMALAHSMGGHILVRNAATQSTWFSRMVLSAPMIRLHPVQLGRFGALARPMAEIACLLRQGERYLPGSEGWHAPEPFDANVVTSDKVRYGRNCAVLEAAPELALGGPTFAWLRATLRSVAEINEPTFPRRINVPLLVFIAGRDTVVLPQAAEDFASRLKVGTHVILANSKHEILQETDDVRGRFWAAFDAYMGVEEQA